MKKKKTRRGSLGARRAVVARGALVSLSIRRCAPQVVGLGPRRSPRARRHHHPPMVQRGLRVAFFEVRYFGYCREVNYLIFTIINANDSISVFNRQ